jgi:two-component system cell cycle response regulator
MSDAGKLSQLLAENQALRDEIADLRRLALLDPLTQMYNRRGLEQRLEPLLNEVRFQTKQPEYLRRNALQSFALVIIDIDHFKKVNDTYGHLAGDLVLQQFGQRIRKNLRGTDVFGRWGGEEFMLGLADLDAASAQVVVDKLHQAIRSEQFRIDDEGKAEQITVTASFGIALAHPQETVTQLKVRADEALYLSKANGRDTITLHDYVSKKT